MTSRFGLPLMSFTTVLYAIFLQSHTMLARYILYTPYIRGVCVRACVRACVRVCGPSIRPSQPMYRTNFWHTGTKLSWDIPKIENFVRKFVLGKFRPREVDLVVSKTH